MKPLPPIIPVREIPETFSNDMSPIEWLAKLTKAYNDLISSGGSGGSGGSGWDITYDVTTSTLTMTKTDEGGITNA